MASNEITFTVKVKKDGNLKVVAKDANKAAKGTEKLKEATDRTTKSRNRFSKGEKGVASAGANSTKNFSKMQQTLMGSGGLVGAYATLAANVFALTAAFGILRRAAAANQLAEGLEYTGTVAGRNLPYIADQLKVITGAAVSTEEAMSAVAIATSAGFSSSQIAKLGEVAKGASLALGRDMTDALNRLIRGSAKLEPELLDELGIMVRLDQAAEDYARELGTTAGALTQFQKRQAFVNAVINEGTTSFSGIAETIDPNAYDQLAAALQDLLKDTVNFLNKGVIPLVKFFSSSTSGLAGGVLLFASTIRGTLLPGLTQGSQKMANFATESKKTAEASLSNVSTTGKLPAVYSTLVTKIKSGTASTEDFTRAQGSLSRSLTKHNSDLVHNSNLQDKTTQQYTDKQATIAGVKAAQQKLNATMVLGAQAETANAKASTINAASKLSLKGVISGIKASLVAYKIEITTTAIANGATSASFVGLRSAIMAAGLSVKAFGIALLTFMPYLALIPIVLGLGKAAYDKFFGDSETTKKINAVVESLSHLTEVGEKLNKTLNKIALHEPKDAKWQVFTATLTATAGAAAQVRDRMHEIIKIDAQGKQKKLADAIERQARFQKQFDNSKGYAPYAQALKSAAIATAKIRAEMDKVNVQPVLDALIASKDNLEKGTLDDGLIDHINKQITDIVKLRNESKDTKEEIDKVLNRPSNMETTAQLLESTKAGLISFSTELGKMKEKVATPFDKMSEGLDETFKALTQTIKGTTTLTKASQALADTIDVKGSPLEKAMGQFRREGETASQTVARMNKSLKEGIKIMQEGPGKIKQQEAELKKLSALRKVNVEVSKRAHKLEDEILDTKKSILDAELKSYDTLEAQTENSAKILEINSQLGAIEAARKTDGQKNLENVQAEVAFAKMVLKSKQKIVEAERSMLDSSLKLMTLAKQRANFGDNLRRTTKLTAKEQIELHDKQYKARNRQIYQEYKLKSALIAMEFRLIDEQYKLMHTQERKQALKSGDWTYSNQILEARSQAGDANKKTQLALLTAATTDIHTGSSTLDLEEQAINEQLVASTTGDSVAERLRNAFADEVNVFEKLNLTEQIKTMTNALDPMIEKFKEFGPEGVAVGTMIRGLQQSGEAWLQFAEILIDIYDKMSVQQWLAMESGTSFWEAMSPGEKMKSVAAGMGAIASSIGALSSVMAAASSNRVAGIDAEIAAEKKRDGKSAQSVAKLKALEQKKDKEKRKAFEINKKLMMAQIIASTAAGVMGAWAIHTMYEAPFAAVVAGIIAAMGVAQLAVVSGLSYGGGGSMGGSTGPKSISVGERSKSSDLSKSQSARGELAYFRGDRGIGGAENFRSAFTGVKHRASGGNTGYIVGEQGPELFMPDRPGTIVPSDDVSVAGGATNVTFSINAIDAAGVEDVLIQQQGNIISMLRQAANSYGEEFMEDIDETTYTTPVAAGGAQRWGS